MATAIAGVKPSEIAALGLPLPSKLKDLAARGGSFPIKGKYGLVSLNDDENDERLLVGPHYFAQARLSVKDYNNSGNDDDDDQAEVDDIGERESSRRPEPDDDKEDQKDNFNKNGDRQVEPVDNSESPYGFEYEKNPIFPPAYEGLYNYLPNPYLPPFNYNLPLPLLNQYLQRRAYNPNLRYSSQVPQYSGVYGQQPYSTNTQGLSPYPRFVYVQ